MTRKSDDPLNRVLRRWHEQNAPTEAALEDLRGRISSSLGKASFLDVPCEPPRSSAGVLRAGLWFFLGAAAAVVLMLIPRGDTPQNPRNQDAAFSPAVELPQAQLAAKARLLAEMEETFNGQLAWEAEHGGQVELGLLPDEGRPSRDAKPLALRIVVLTRKAGESAWKPIWQTDAIARDDEVVDLPWDRGRDGSLRIWMHPLPDGAIAIDTDLRVSGPTPVRSTFSGVQQDGAPLRVFAAQNEDAEYQVYQTVALLAAK